MNALILAAGYGKRLRPLTNKIPKCLIKIGKKPLLQIWLEKLDRQGIKKFLINTHYKPKQIERFVKKSKYGNRIKLVNEEKLLGTGGTLFKNLNFFEGKDGIVLHCDNFSIFSIKSFLKKNSKKPKNTLISLLTFKTHNFKDSGIIKQNKKNIVEYIYEKKTKNYGNLANGAFYILSKKILKSIARAKKKPNDIVKDILMNNYGKIYTIHTNAFYIDIGNFNNLKKARSFKKNVK